MNYYVYELRRANGVPFYVGKGTRARAAFHEWAAKQGWVGHVYATIRKIWKSGGKVERAKVATRLTNEQAIAIERELIEKYGRRVRGGLLVNMTDGGEGAEGYRHDLVSLANMRSAWGKRAPVSEETREKLRQAGYGRKWNKEQRKTISQRMMGGKHWNYGKHISEEHKAKLRKSVSRAVIIHGVEYGSISEASRSLGIHQGTIFYRCTRGIGFPDYRIKQSHI